MIWCDMMLYHGHHQGTSLKMCFLTKPLREALVFAASKSSHGNLEIIKLEIPKKKQLLYETSKCLGISGHYTLSRICLYPSRLLKLLLLLFFALLEHLVKVRESGDNTWGCWEAVSRPIVQQENLPHNMCIQIHSYVCLGPNVQILNSLQTSMCSITDSRDNMYMYMYMYVYSTYCILISCLAL